MSEAMRQAADSLDPELKRRTDAMMKADPEVVACMVQAAFLAGMQLSMRLLRNRAEDLKQIDTARKIWAEDEVQNCVGIIRLCQVEIGSGRMARPQLTKAEIEEMDRIS